MTSVVGEDLAESRGPEPPWEAGSDTAHNGLERPRALSIQSTGGEVGLSAALLPEADTAAGVSSLGWTHRSRNQRSGPAATP